MIHPDLLAIIACPDTRQPLKEAGAELLAAINARIAAGGVTNVGGTELSQPLEAGLVREDGEVIYPVRDDIPVLLVDEGIRTS